MIVEASCGDAEWQGQMHHEVPEDEPVMIVAAIDDYVAQLLGEARDHVEHLGLRAADSARL